MTPTGAALAQRMAAMPRWVRVGNPIAEPWVTMTVRVEPAQLGYLEPLVARITIRNATDRALSMSFDRHRGTIPGRVALVANVRLGAQPMGDSAPIIVDAARRLRLGPKQAIELPVRLDRGDLGAALVGNPFATVTLSVRAMLDPVPTGNGWAPSPLGSIDTTRSIVRQGQPLTPANLEDWIRTAEDRSASLSERMRAIAALAAARQPAAGAQGEATATAPASDQAQEIAKTLAVAYASLDEIGQAWAVSLLPQQPNDPDPLQRMHDSAARSPSPLVRTVHLAVSVRDAQSPELTAALRGEPGPVADFARALRQLLLAAPPAAATAPSP